MRFGAAFSDFVAWWLDELSGAFPMLAARFAGSADVNLLVGSRGGTFPVYLQKGAEGEVVSVEDPDALGVLLERAFGRKRETLGITVSPGRYVERSLAEISLPVSRARMMADIDVESNTPFDIDDVFVAFPEYRSRQAGTRYFVFKKSDLQPFLQTVRRAGHKLTSIAVGKGDTSIRIRRSDLRRIREDRFSERLARWMGIAIAAVLVVGTVGAYYLEMQRLDEAERSLSVQVDEARREAGRVRVQYDARMKLLDQMASIRKEKNLTNSAVYLWEQLSRTLPDDSWLTDMKIEDGVLTISGYSQSAASLISLIEEADGFSDPQFMSAVVKSPNVEAEHFTLQATIDGPQS